MCPWNWVHGNAFLWNGVTEMAKIGIIGDTHCPVMVDGYAEWCMDVFSQWDIERIIHIGDLSDQHSASMHASEIGFYDIVSEMEATREQVAHLVDVFGDNVEVMQGNLDANLGRKMKLVGLDPALLKTPEDIWGVNWTFYPRFHKLIIDDCIYMHGDQSKGGKTPSLAKAEAEWMSVICGHHHSAAGVSHPQNLQPLDQNHHPARTPVSRSFR